ncbi:MAG: hypothetical protein ACI9PC_000030 [Porticoccaceae bacterium]|jgi:hypothetical protein
MQISRSYQRNYVYDTRCLACQEVFIYIKTYFLTLFIFLTNEGNGL